MHDLPKESVLRKVLVSSAFVLALCILPAAQYFLVSKQLPRSEQGDVAGVSTSEDIIRASVPQSACADQKAKELQQLKDYALGQEVALQQTYNQERAAVKTEVSLEGSAPGETESSRIRDTYLKNVAELESVVESQKKEIDSRSCDAE